MTIYLEAPIQDDDPLEGLCIFLAGGISNCWNWQNHAAAQLLSSKVFDYVVNPRRKDFDVTNKLETSRQIKWEYKHLDECSHVMFWFTDDTVQPITLFELGKMIGTDKKIYVGCNPQYERQLDVVEQLALSRPDIKVWGSLDGMLDSIIASNIDKRVYI